MEGQADDNITPLGRWMDQRRAELRLTWDDVADRSGISKQALYKIRRGSVPRALTRRDLQEALRWKTGSVDAILAGGEPVPLDDVEAAHKPPEEQTEIDELREIAALARARAQESLEFASRLEERIDKLGQLGERRAVQ